VWSVIGIVALSACGDPNTQIDPAAQPAASAAVATVAPNVQGGPVPESLAFSAPRVGGGTIDMADYAGKPVLLWFWAPT
jgi:hypothetical protein